MGATVNEPEGEPEDAEGDCVATPIPLPASRPRSEQRFTISGYPGRYRLVCDLCSGSAAVDPTDVTRPRDTNSVLAVLGERLAEFERTDS